MQCGRGSARRKLSQRGSRAHVRNKVADYLSGSVLLISDPGQYNPGGLFAVSDEGVQEVDRLGCMGLAIASETRMLRALRTPIAKGGGAELLIYDSFGVERYLRIDGVSDVHDVLWDGEHFVLVATGENSIVWIDTAGSIRRTWHADGDRDAWHLTNLFLHEARLFVCAFGRFAEHRGWEHGSTGHGVVVDVESGTNVLDGLSCPHNPQVVDDLWLVCNSAADELLLYNEQRELVRTLELAGWTRGVAATDRYVFVGESRDRKSPTKRNATVAVIDRSVWDVVDRFEIAGSGEIYDIIAVTPQLAEGVMTGFRTNPTRTRTLDGLELFSAVGLRPQRPWAPGYPLLLDDLRANVVATIPETLPSADVVTVECQIENRGRGVFSSAPPSPVHVSYRWVSSEGDSEVQEPLRTALPQTLPPHVPVFVNVAVRTPVDAGKYTLRIRLVQEFVGWFDEIDPGSKYEQAVHVVSPEVPPDSNLPPPRVEQQSGPGKPLPASGFLVSIDTPELPAMSAGEHAHLVCVVTNNGTEILQSGLPHPIHLSYRLFDAATGELVDDGPRSDVPELAPGKSVELELELVAPGKPGSYLAGITLVQELVAWFDDVEPTSGAYRSLSVRRVRQRPART